MTKRCTVTCWSHGRGGGGRNSPWLHRAPSPLPRRRAFTQTRYRGAAFAQKGWLAARRAGHPRQGLQRVRDRAPQRGMSWWEGRPAARSTGIFWEDPHRRGTAPTGERRSVWGEKRGRRDSGRRVPDPHSRSSLPIQDECLPRRLRSLHSPLFRRNPRLRDGPPPLSSGPPAITRRLHRPGPSAATQPTAERRRVYFYQLSVRRVSREHDAPTSRRRSAAAHVPPAADALGPGRRVRNGHINTAVV